MARTPNTECSVCSKSVYRRPNELRRLKNVYCSRRCQGAPFQAKKTTRLCAQCKQEFTYPSYLKRKYCSTACSNKARRGITYSKGGLQNKQAVRLIRLQRNSGTKCCMVSGCSYSKCFDIHRLVEGKDGGKYEDGNMFAICPNHHAEIHRGLIKVKQSGQFSLCVSHVLAESQLDKYV